MSSEMNVSQDSACTSQNHSCLPSWPQFLVYPKEGNAASPMGANTKLQEEVVLYG